MPTLTVGTENVNIGIESGSREAVAKELKKLLADEFVLYAKTRNFHWNVVGPRFHDLHLFFESQYEELDEFVDEVAERIRQLGAVSPGSLAEFVKESELTEVPGGTLKSDDMISKLHADHETLIRSLRKGLQLAEKHGDQGTMDFLTGLMEKHEKMAWMLRAHLETV